MGAPASTETTLTCTAEAWPKPINYWTFGTGEMIVANEKFVVQVGRREEGLTWLYLQENQINGYKFQLVLVIKRLEAPQDFGTYRCISKNSIGQAEETVELYGEEHHWPRISCVCQRCRSRYQPRCQPRRCQPRCQRC